MTLKEESRGLNAVRLTVWLSEDAMELGLGAAQTVGAAKTTMAESCLVIWVRVAVQGLAELLGCKVGQRKVLPQGLLGG